MESEIDFLKRIVKQAENISKEDFSVKSKGTENDLVTNLDLKIEKYLISEINTQYPDFDIVSEEFNSNKNPTENCFILDPIDGTINFANGLPLWAIQISCIKDGKTVAAVINIPKINELYWADEEGSYLNDKRISINEVSIKNALYTVNGGNVIPALQKMRKYTTNRRNFNSVGVSLAFVASGKIHGAVFVNDNPWDYEPGMFICKMAGASIKSIKGFHAVAMNKEFLDILELETAKKENTSNIFVLHSLNGDTLKMWGKDIKGFFEEKGINVFLPEFPIREESKYEKFKEILEFYIKNGTLNEKSIVIAHSIGNAYFIRFCSELRFKPKAYIAVAPGAVYEYPSNRNDYIIEVKKQSYVKNEYFDYVKNSLNNKYCLYSDEDDNNSEKFARFLEDTGSKGMYLKYYNHFDGYHRIYRIPELIELVNDLL